MSRRLRGLIVVVAMLVLAPAIALGTNHIDHGQWGTANHDYFSDDPTVKALLKNVELNHMVKHVLGPYQVGRYNDSIDNLQYTLVRFPNHPHALVLMGLLAKTTKNFTLPIEYFQKALTLYPHYAITHALFGQYLVDIGMVGPGVERLNDALKVDPNLSQAYAGLAVAHQKMGHRDQARTFAQRARELGYRGKLDLTE
ncbi:MAG: tetratricopeptide repeat protein [Candidatus Rokuibacteriota bacterium]